MSAPVCIFCKIINNEIPSTVILQRETVLVIQDIKPAAPQHYLIMPKIHISDLNALRADQHAALAFELLDVARELGQQAPHQAFNVVVNNGVQAGQSVFHLHFHFLAGRNIYEGGLTL